MPCFKGTEDEKEKQKDTYESYMKLRVRDKKRFEVADEDQDGKLNKTGNVFFVERF